jgi:hypothetical protein
MTLSDQDKGKIYTNRRSPSPGDATAQVEQGIQAARTIFGKCFFDFVKCFDGIQALRHYRYEVDEKLGGLRKEPLHDQYSHAADAFRTAA